ncbi:MAG: LysM peptidoglycan-binding domain-containing protein [Gammaproteobacteria bacterium]
MVFRALLRLLVPLLFCLNSWADDIAVKADHPNRYVVVEGDTLWDIAGRFLEQPWQWPRIWHNNPQIHNPNLIYPGDVIVFSLINGKPQLSLEGYGMRRNDSAKPLFYPHARETPISEAVHLIPVNAIAPYLSSPRVVGKDELAGDPYIVSIAGEHIVAGAGDRVYVRSITQPETLAYTVYRQGQTYTSPGNNEILGYEAQYVADLILEKTGDPATLKVSKSSGELRPGDRIMPSEKGQIALNYFPQTPETEISGYIISVLNGVTQIGRNDIVVIDRGTNDGVQIGHVLNIYNSGGLIRDPFSPISNEMVKLPDELAGVLMVFRTFDRVSYALVMQAGQALHVGDTFKST